MTADNESGDATGNPKPDSKPPFQTSASDPNDRLSPFKPTDEQHATGEAAAIDRFSPPVIPAERGPAPKPEGAAAAGAGVPVPAATTTHVQRPGSDR